MRNALINGTSEQLIQKLVEAEDLCESTDVSTSEDAGPRLNPLLCFPSLRYHLPKLYHPHQGPSFLSTNTSKELTSDLALFFLFRSASKFS